MIRPTPTRLADIRGNAETLDWVVFRGMAADLLSEVDALIAERGEAREDLRTEARRADECGRDMHSAWRERDVAIDQCRRLTALLSQARTGTRPDGSGCWCDPEEWEQEYNARVDESLLDDPLYMPMDMETQAAMGGERYHTALCREITEALR